MNQLNLDHIYWIGGSPCAGKTTISEILVKEYDLEFYKSDDYLDQHFEIGRKRKYPLMSKYANMTCDEIWMRDIDFQVKEEFEYYKEELKLVMEELHKYPKDKKILVEGTAILPEFIEQLKIPHHKAVFIVPTAKFQLKHYKKRQFIPYVLEGCTNQEKAYENWMKRDIKFAEEVVRQVRLYKRNLIVTDGKRSLVENKELVEKIFKL